MPPGLLHRQPRALSPENGCSKLSNLAGQPPPDSRTSSAGPSDASYRQRRFAQLRAARLRKRPARPIPGVLKPRPRPPREAPPAPSTVSFVFTLLTDLPERVVLRVPEARRTDSRSAAKTRSAGRRPQLPGPPLGLPRAPPHAAPASERPGSAPRGRPPSRDSAPARRPRRGAGAEGRLGRLGVEDRRRDEQRPGHSASRAQKTATPSRGGGAGEAGSEARGGPRGVRAADACSREGACPFAGRPDVYARRGTRSCEEERCAPRRAGSTCLRTGRASRPDAAGPREEANGRFQFCGQTGSPVPYRTSGPCTGTGCYPAGLQSIPSQ
ncbi:Triple Functional Domain Protein [Manis pentadactyla]|nr:Triple Functional Domain Protein [Manis pentadactyla]